MGQTSWHGKGLRVFSLQMPFVPLWAKPQGTAAAVGRAGRGEAWRHAWPRPGAHSHALLLRDTSPGGVRQHPGNCGKVSAWHSTSQPLPRRGLWSCGKKPGLNWGQPGGMRVSGCESLRPAPMMMLFYSYRKGVSNTEIWT